MTKRLPILLILFTALTYAQSEMKCTAGKCSGGKASINKKIPTKGQKRKIKSTESTIPQSSPSKGTPQLKQPDKKVATKSGSHHAKPVTVKQLFNVRTVKVTAQQTAREMTNYGYIVADEARKRVVTPLFSGYVKKLFVKERYSKVKEGDPLLSIYAPEVYKAKLEYLNALKFNAKHPAAAMVKSAKQKLILLGVDKREIARIKAQQSVDPLTTLYAPQDGWIIEKSVFEGSYASAKKPLFMILDLHSVWMEALLYQEQLEAMEEMQKYAITLKGFHKRFNAHKEHLYPILDPKASTATLRLRIENPDGFLKPGMYATLHSYGKTVTRLILPRTAVIRKNGKWYAFLATEFEGEYEPIEVKVKPLDDERFEIIEGLKEGERVVNNALFMMDSDAQINGIY